MYVRNDCRIPHCASAEVTPREVSPSQTVFEDALPANGAAAAAPLLLWADTLLDGDVGADASLRARALLAAAVVVLDPVEGCSVRTACCDDDDVARSCNDVALRKILSALLNKPLTSTSVSFICPSQNAGPLVALDRMGPLRP